MTVELDQAHAAAGLNLLRADTALTVHDGRVPDGAVPPYVVVYTTVEWPTDDPDNGIDHLSTTCVTRWFCHCVGSNAAAARAVAGRVRVALLDVRPPIPGRVCERIKSEAASAPPRRDESTGRLVMDAVQVYRMRSRPA